MAKNDHKVTIHTRDGRQETQQATDEEARGIEARAMGNPDVICVEVECPPRER